ncbi:MAG: ATP-binding cassette domain-containing protein, partial [Thermodesulfobacteriota bacterium]
MELSGVERRFMAGKRVVQALSGVSFTVLHGRITGLIGPDGAGKTTLMRLCSGLLLPDAGKITVMGTDVAAEPLAVQASIGYMPQRFGLYEDLSVRENLDLYADLQGVQYAEREARYSELMHMTGMARFMDRLAGRLSGGMKQKLGLACTLVRPPELLLLDEPTVGVDPVSRRELWAIVSRLVRDQGMSVLLSTAYLDEAERCDDIVVLHEGKILGRGGPAAFSAKVRGRSFLVTAGDTNKRTLQESLSARPEVLDAVIQGDGVRVVSCSDDPAPSSLIPPGIAAEAVAVPPRFEDGLMVLLHKQRTGPSGEAECGSPGKAFQTINAKENGGPVIRVMDVKKRFGDFYAVDGVSFDVAGGEVFGLLGANGAGKTTTFRMLCGLLPATQGHLSVAGVDLRFAAAQARARIGYMSQKFSLYGNLSVRQNLRFFASAYNLTGARRAERMGWALSEFELAEVADATSLDLPLGFKQRLAMACSLMHEPDILFLDEPTSGVDPL